jgi:hypothetical protein
VLRLRKILPIHRTVTLGVFLDIEEAFDSTLFDIIIRQTSGTDLDTIFQLVSYMLGDIFTATLEGKTLERSAAKGCLQRSILSPLLWSLIVDQFTERLCENSCYTVGYTDDIAI